MSELIQKPLTKVVLDTNIWLDLLLFKDINLNYIINAIHQKHLQVYACQKMYDELARVLHYPQFSKYNHDINQCLEQFNNYVIYLATPPNLAIPVKCKDIDDQVFLDFCGLYNINFLISKDKQVLKLAKNMRKLGVKVIPPNLFS